jgi:hypothetical protein
MQATEIKWTQTEKKIAQQAFQKAYEREINALLQLVREQASEISELDDLWRLNDFLSARRHEIDSKYDYQYSILIFTFASLVKARWLHIDELKGLDADKIAKINALTRI